MYRLHVGIDDTDSPDGMCTTYISCVIIQELKSCGFSLEDHPRLIRLNPFAPHKTRGNGAVTFTVLAESREDLNTIKGIVLEGVAELAELDSERTNPGVVFYTGEITEEMREFALSAIRRILRIEDARRLAERVGAEVHGFKKGRGIIGALAAIGCPLDDSTYELLTYRVPENYGKPRRIDPESVARMDDETGSETFDNIDGDYIAIEPHTPCPILYGIRGESPEVLLRAMEMVRVDEEVERYCIFETNQHTDQHIQDAGRIADMETFGCYRVRGEVIDGPRVIEGGHVFFTLGDDSGQIECGAYEPTKDFRKIILELIPGDVLTVYGGIGAQGTMNIEKIHLERLAELYVEENPICTCGKRMKSAGRNKGFKCPSCGRRLRSSRKVRRALERSVVEGYYEVPTCARRHLSKQLVRMGISSPPSEAIESSSTRQSDPLNKKWEDL
ncbi:tRNA(Ile)(2)-agmatinylcytidine synthase [Methanothermobacter sp. EMTCatA1]|uniref:tRNA(Ile2) 2-agmatinylcytidine synthetase TiaS n=1 Tax=Methanothermobacter thermautotrophicus TaxID=145262 RepID=A0A7J4MUB2_METTF|nr:tRNA(Ile)(2)-agmatinylcytidine synthase [Methanothermobacter sp. EMTCatA1]BAZ98995.1 hypothetical protein tca_00929 [Methanothermobacter sp. EMTCatA1]HIH64328.1 DUF1743 domain-containing protein [Methanothermobacter thermautotrophicus]HIH71160.1 DUF1743 domain-containing protein [Methanothermobacter thermautotrophicus]